MRYSEQIVPISYLKDNTAKIANELANGSSPLVITQNGVAKLVIQDIKSYESTQETIALLKILALGNEQIRKNECISLDDAISKIKTKSSEGIL